MNSFFKKNGFVGGVTMIVIILAIVVILWNKLLSNKRGSEGMYGSVGSYGNVQSANSANPNNPIKQFEHVQQKKASNQLNQNELLPNDTNSGWAALNPSGSGELGNINLLKSGYHQGIDTVGSSLRNANLQIRSEPPNPTLSVGPWNQSTITPDFMRVPLEIGCGKQ